MMRILRIQIRNTDLKWRTYNTVRVHAIFYSIILSHFDDHVEQIQEQNSQVAQKSYGYNRILIYNSDQNKAITAASFAHSETQSGQVEP